MYFTILFLVSNAHKFVSLFHRAFVKPAIFQLIPADLTTRKLQENVKSAEFKIGMLKLLVEARHFFLDKIAAAPADSEKTQRLFLRSNKQTNRQSKFIRR